MKVAAAAADRFVGAPPAEVMAVLLYGPDSGLVQERAVRLVRSAVDDPKDPFRIVDLPAGSLREDPARLADEAAAMSLTGGRRAVRVRDATDSVGDILADFVSGKPPGDALVIVEAGNLGPRSKLRKAFEDSKNAAAIACYADEGRSLASVISDSLGERISVSPDAMTYLCANLGSDRLVSRSELEKLRLYMGPDGGTVGLAEAAACVGDSAAMTLDDLAFAVSGGDLKQLPRLIERVRQEGTAPVSILRALGRHFQRLHLASALVAEGAAPDAAVKALRPPIFFKQADMFRAHLARWAPGRIEAALAAITEAELACKTTGLPAETITQQTLLRVAALARTGRRAG